MDTRKSKSTASVLCFQNSFFQSNFFPKVTVEEMASSCVNEGLNQILGKIPSRKGLQNIGTAQERGGSVQKMCGCGT